MGFKPLRYLYYICLLMFCVFFIVLDAEASVVLNYSTEKITGVSTSMEYSINNGTSWSTCTGTEINISSLISNTTSLTIKVRTKATSSAPASDANSFILPKRASAPSATLSYATEKLSGVTTAMEYSIDDWMTKDSVTSSTYDVSSLIPANGESSKTLKVRIKATSTAFSSQAKSITLKSRQADISSSPSYDSETAIVSNVASTMEYTVNDGATWTAISGATLNVSSLIPASSSSNVTLKIRTKATSLAAASESVSITLSKRASAPTGLTLDYANEKMTGITADALEYSTGTNWSTISATYLGLGSIISNTANVTLQIRTKATSSDPASDAESYTLTKRASAPSATLSYATEKLSGVTTEMEYSIDDWTTTDSVTSSTYDVSSLIPANGESSKILKVRIKATSTAFCSQAKSITLLSRLENISPAPELDFATERVTGVDNTMEYSINGTTWTVVSSVYIDVSSLIPLSTDPSDVTLYVRKKSTSSAAASWSTEITLPRRLAF